MAGRPLDHQPHSSSSVSTQPAQRSSALKIVVYYVLFSCLWILFSDQLLSDIISDKNVLTRWQTLKGWTFVVITAFMLYALIARSIAAIQQSHVALVESESKFRRVVESNMIGIIFWKENGQILDANDAFLKTVGYTREDLLAGKLNWREMTPAEYRGVDDEADKERKKRGSCSAYEKEYLLKDGSRAPVLVGGATLNEAEGTHIAFVLDITKRKRFEQALPESERQFWEILENLQLLSIMFDQDGSIMFCNDFVLNLTGWRFEDVVGRNWFDTFVPLEQREIIRFTFTEMLRKGMSPATIEYEIQTRDGE